MRLILLGAPGVGKGTQGMKLAEFFGIPKLSTGEILRAEVAAKTELGLKVAEILDNGFLVSDEIVESIVSAKLCNDIGCRNGFILDGFPRTLHQAFALDKILAGLSWDDLFVINIAMDINKLISRLSGRVNCRDCGYTFNVNTDNLAEIRCLRCGSVNCYQREDDKKEAVMKRLEVYNQLTKPMIDYYRQQNSWIEVNGDDTIDAVFDNIMHAIKSKLSGVN